MINQIDENSSASMNEEKMIQEALKFFSKEQIEDVIQFEYVGENALAVDLMAAIIISNNNNISNILFVIIKYLFEKYNTPKVCIECCTYTPENMKKLESLVDPNL